MPLATALRLLLPLAIMVSLLLVVGGTMWSGTRWLLATEDGTRRLLGALPGVQAEGLHGALLGPRLQIDLLQVRWDRGEQSVRIEGLDLQGIAWRRSLDAGLWFELDIARAAARRVVVDTGPRGPRPLPTPASLSAPLRVAVAAAELDELRVDRLAPLSALRAEGALFDGRRGQSHRVARAQAHGFGLAMQASASIGNQAPLPVQLEGRVAPADSADGAPWSATLSASGPFTRLALRAALRSEARTAAPRRQTPPAAAQHKAPPPVARGGAATDVPRLDAEAELHPLEAWPIRHLRLATDALDLAVLVPGAPHTRIAGRADIAAPSHDAPITADVHLTNRTPGRWDEGRLPLARLALELRGDLAHPARVQAPRFEIDLADAGGVAGRVGGKLVWDTHQLDLDARLDNVTPQRLDGRAASMTLTGPLAFELRGLPSPDRADAREPPPWHASARLTLDGRVQGAPTTVRLEAAGSADAGRLDIARLHASAGAARADLTASLARIAGGGWQLASGGSVDDFDPVPWWPGESSSAWRQGPHRIDANWRLDVRVPARAREMPPLRLLQSLVGSARLRVHDSVLAGVPVTADLALGSTDAAAATTLHVQLEAGGNQFSLDGSADPLGSGMADRWRAGVQADRLAALAPLLRLHPAFADWLPTRGSANATVSAEGRWPDMASNGQAHVEQLRAGTLAVARGDLQWRLQVGRGAEPNAPLALTAQVSGMSLGNQRADQLRAQLRGTLASHHIELLGTLPVAPPPLVEQLLGASSPHGTRALLEAQGTWQADPAGGGRWRAQVDRLAVGPWDGSSAADAPLAGALWADTGQLRAELSFDRAGSLRALQAEPGRLLLAGGAVALRWDAVQADLRDERTDVELRASIEPFALAPLLARAQPAAGWQGDLRLSARVAIKAAERFETDMVFERRDGDLQLAGEDSVQHFGLTEFRLALTAHDGVWDFSPVFSGRSLGDIRGTLRARTAPEARWPRADAPIEGQIQARVADIGIWTGWVPPGWRLVGQVQTTASLGGRFGAPTYTGELSGSGIGVRNLLQGVNVRDGELRVVLAGDSARIENFSARGGDGLVQITGGASLGEAPSARLELKAERFRVLGRLDRQLTASGHAQIVLGAGASRVDGSFRIDDGLFDFSRSDAPSLDDDVTVHGANRTEAAPIAPQARQRRDFALALDVDLGDRMRARGRGVDTGLRGSLRITNPAARPNVDGTIRTDGGTYAAYGQKLDIERGSIVFTGAVDNPRLDILAIRPNTDVRVGVLITGNAQSPRVQLYSEPQMSESDKLSWLLLGRASEGLGRNDTAIIQRAAVALLAGEGEAPTDTLLRRLGLDDLSVRQSDTDVRETVISLGKQLSRRWYVGYERGVNATTGTWQLIYRIAQRLTVRMQSGFESAVDILWTWRLQEAPPESGVRKSVPARAP